MIPPGETIIETKECPISGQEFHITDADIAFYDQISPVFAGTKHAFPAPVYAPDIRSQMRMAFRNERTFHHHRCALSGENIVSMYDPEDGYKACKIDLWRGDGWSAFDTGRDFDFDRPFFEQFDELYHDTPVMALYQSGTVENCEYTNWFGGQAGAKNCYLCTNGGFSEDCMYMRGVVHSRDCYDMYYGTQNENCYECIDVKDCYQVFFSQNCTNCRESSFLNNCVGCTNCFGCINLSNKQYHIFNQPHTKDEYFAKLSELHLTLASIESISHKVRTFFLSQPFRATQNLGAENCVGDYILDSKDCFIAYEANGCENGKYLDSTKFLKDSHDVLGYGYNADHFYQTVGVGEGSSCAFCISGDVASDQYYSMWTQSCSNLFGCVSLHQVSHCAFNKSYGKQEYEQLCSKIADHMASTEEWGEFFPPAMSPFGYNETIGQDFYPLSDEELVRRGWRWRGVKDYDEVEGSGYIPLEITQYDEKTVRKQVAQENIQKCLKQPIVCKTTGRPFRIQPRELAFYIEHSLPIPDRHPTARHQNRVTTLNHRGLHDRNCSLCNIGLMTTYSNDQPEKIVCEKCYRETVY